MKRILFFALCILSFSVRAKETPALSVEGFFSALNLDYPGLEKVKADVNRADYKAATADYVAYLKVRDNFKYFFEWKDKTKFRNPAYKTEEADKYASNLIVSCGVWHQFGDPISDWSANPTPQKYVEWTWELNRMQFWRVLADAYYATGNEKYTDAFVKQMRSWVTTSPYPDYPNREPGSRWRTIEAGIRMLHSWPYAFLHFLGSESFDDESVVLMVRSFYEHGEYLRNFRTSVNNWLLMELNGLFQIAILFPEFKKSPEWARYAADKLYEEEKIQFYEDGAQVELAPGYHKGSVNDVIQIYDLAKLNNYPLNPDFDRRLEKSYEYFVNICTPEWTVPALNDSYWAPVADPMKKGYSLFPERRDFLYLATKGEQGTEPHLSTWMPWAGWYIMRNAWKGDNIMYAHFEVGPLSPAHSHEDKLSFILYGYGDRLLSDCGLYAYDSSKWSQYSLSARGHNVSRVDGLDQMRKEFADRSVVDLNHAPMTNRWIQNDVFEFGEGWFTEGFGPQHDSTVTQYRALTYVKNKYWLVFDVFTPKDDKLHRYDSWFHFMAPECKALPNLSGMQSVSKDRANLAIIPLCPSNGTVSVICAQEEPELQGWLINLPDYYYKAAPSATPVFHRQKKGQMLDPYLFYPIRKGEDCPVKRIKSDGKGNFDILFNDGGKDKVSVVLEGNSIKTLTINGVSL